MRIKEQPIFLRKESTDNIRIPEKTDEGAENSKFIQRIQPEILDCSPKSGTIFVTEAYIDSIILKMKRKKKR